MTTTQQAFNSMREALLSIDQHIDLSKYAYAPPNVTLADVTKSALAAAKAVELQGRTNSGDETGGAVKRFGFLTVTNKPPLLIPATNGAYVYYSDYLALWKSKAVKPQPERQPLVPDADADEWASAIRCVFITARKHDNTIPSHWLDAMRDHLLKGQQ